MDSENQTAEKLTAFEAAMPLPPPNEKTAEELPGPDNPPWSSPVAFAAWFVSVLLIIFVPPFFLIPYVVTQNVSLQDSAALSEFATKDPTAILLQIVGIIPAHILTFALAWIIVTNLNKRPFFEMVGWNWGGFNIWYCILTVLGFFVLAVGLTAIFGEQDHELQRILRSSRTVVYVVALMATFTAPMVEEIIYRGILYSAFQRSFGAVWAVVSVTFLFAAVHFWQYQSSPVALLMILSLSLVLTLIRAKTGNLLPCFALHTIFNGLQSVLMILQPLLPEVPVPPVENASFIFRLLN